MLKSLYRKKLHSYFHSRPGFEPTDLQNDTFLQTCALAHAATELCIKFCNNTWYVSEQISKSNFKPLAQESASSYGKSTGLFL